MGDDVTQGKQPKGSGPGRLTISDVMRICGHIDEVKAAKIIATGATLKDLEEAVLWAEGAADTSVTQRQPTSPVVAALYDILITEEQFPDDLD